MDPEADPEKMIDEGYIKFDIQWEKAPPVPENLDQIIQVRNRLYQQRLIGFYEEHQVGYGNISVLSASPPQFIVSGTQTGHIPQLGKEHFTIATAWDLDANSLSCVGPVKASSESLTHAAVYACSPEIKAVIHVHHLELWQWMLSRYPSTDPAVPYGTPEMAGEVTRLYATTNLPECAAFSMAGHEEGIFTFAEDLQEAYTILNNIFEKWQAETAP